MSGAASVLDNIYNRLKVSVMNIRVASLSGQVKKCIWLVNIYPVFK